MAASESFERALKKSIESNVLEGFDGVDKLSDKQKSGFFLAASPLVASACGSRCVGLRPAPKIPAAREKNHWYPGKRTNESVKEEVEYWNPYSKLHTSRNWNSSATIRDIQVS